MCALRLSHSGAWRTHWVGISKSHVTTANYYYYKNDSCVKHCLNKKESSHKTSLIHQTVWCITFNAPVYLFHSYRDRIVPVLDTIVPPESNKPYDILDVIKAVSITVFSNHPFARWSAKWWLMSSKWEQIQYVVEKFAILMPVSFTLCIVLWSTIYLVA